LTDHRFRFATVRRLLLPVLALLAMPACRFGAPPPETDQARHIAGLYELMFWVAIGVGGITLGLILFSVIRYRRTSEELPKQTRYHVPLEITYTVIPVLIVLGLFVATWRVERNVDRIAANPAVTVEATAFQWQWRFSYPQYGIDIIGSPTKYPVFLVPVGETVHVDLHAEDVIHAFYVPDFLFKRDTIPGQLNQFDIRIPRAGKFLGECAEFCGLNHSEMTFYVRAVPRAQFDRWVQQQQQAQATPTAAATPASPSPTTSPT
jgi:cytochrome c oxidase subunit II